MLTVGFFWAVEAQVGVVEEENMNKKDFQISIKLSLTVLWLMKQGDW